jgi:hypothetical protein
MQGHALTNIHSKLASFFHVITRLDQALWTVVLITTTLVLGGCQLTNKTANTGRDGADLLARSTQDQTTAVDHSTIYLDVAIPVFDPGIAQNSKTITKEGIWPQLRRAEANRFALMTKIALQKKPVFGNISVVPSIQATADLYILGSIKQSNSEHIKLGIEIVDITGRRWDKLTFSHQVDKNFFKKHPNKDPYEAVFNKIADHVVKLLKHKRDDKRENIKRVAEMRFAQSFLPEAFSKHLKRDRYDHISLDSLPSADDPMLNRVAPLRVQEQLFFDRMQAQYERFSLKTDESYRLWQQQTLSYLIAARDSNTKSVLKGIAGGVAILLAILAATNSSSDIAHAGTQLGTMLGTHLIKQSMKDNAEASVHYAAIDEMGENLDIKMDGHVLSLQDKTIELTGTAQQQYQQWKKYLKDLYLLEQTPAKNL